MSQSSRDEDDEAIDRELSRLDFATLDLSALDDESSLLGMRPRAPTLGTPSRIKGADGTILPWFRWVVTIGLVLAGWFIVWFPNTPAYHASASRDLWFMLICLGATGVGLTLARWLWQWGMDNAAREEFAPQNPVVTWEFPPSVTRWGPVLLIAGGGMAILLTTASGPGMIGIHDSSSALWYVVFIASLGMALLGLRWIFLHGAKPDADGIQTARKPIVFPPWLKWVNLGVLVLAGLFTVFGSAFFGGNNSEPADFAFGGIGFAVGVLGAIWVARRFDEAEKKFKEQTRHQQRK